MTSLPPPRRRIPLRGLTIVAAMAVVLATWVVTAQSPGRPPTVGISLIDGGSTTTTMTTTTTSSDDSTPATASTTPPPPTPAPADYGTQLDDMYAQLYAVATALPGEPAAAGEATPAAFDAQVASANASNLGYVNQQLSESTVEHLTATVAAAVPVENEVASALDVRRTHATTRTRYTSDAGHPHEAIAHFTATLVEPQALTTIPESLPNSDPYVDDTMNSYTSKCPSGAPPINSADVYDEGVLFAIQIGIDVVGGAYNIVSPGAGTDGGTAAGLAIAAGIIAGAGLALQIAEDTLSYFQTNANDCQGAQIQQVGVDTDNNAYQTYTLLTAVAGTANETDQEVANLTNQDTAEFDQQLTADIEATLTQPVGTTPVAVFELPVSFEGLTFNGYLNSSPVGVAEVVATAISNMQTTGQNLSPSAIRDQTLANQALAAGEFKLAFDYFRLAYQAAAG